MGVQLCRALDRGKEMGNGAQPTKKEKLVEIITETQNSRLEGAGVMFRRSSFGRGLTHCQLLACLLVATGS